MHVVIGISGPSQTCFPCNQLRAGSLKLLLLLMLLLMLLLLAYVLQHRLSELVAASQPGDVLFFHYSGHGTQVNPPAV
jgi:hypothetical protein